MNQENHINKWLDGTLTKEEQKKFEASGEYKSLEKLSKATLAFKAPEYNTEEELARLQARSNVGKVVRVDWVRPLLSIAAVFLLVIGAGYFYFTNDNSNSLEAISVIKESFFLPDSSEVILNTHSELKYSKNEWGNKRIVELNGEGFFKVSKGSKFEILTELGSVKVLGTEFNVKIRQGYFEVICYEGSVEVETREKTAVLNPRQMFRIIDGVISEGEASPQSSPSWIEGESTFMSIPLIQVLEEFERQYGVSVGKEGLGIDQLFTGRFTHRDINLALNSIAIPLNLEYQIVDNHVIFTSDLKN
jgi:transmembrane sensor